MFRKNKKCCYNTGNGKRCDKKALYKASFNGEENTYKWTDYFCEGHMLKIRNAYNLRKLKRLRNK